MNNAILATIRKYRRERFWWNETATALACVVNVQTLAHPADMLFLDRLEVISSGNNADGLVEKDFDYVRKLNVQNSTGLPTVFAQYGDRFYLANVPDSAYAVNCYYVMDPAPLSADSDTNILMDNAEDVIAYGAASLVWGATIRNVSAAQVCAAIENTYITELRNIRDQRLNGQIRPTRF